MRLKRGRVGEKMKEVKSPETSKEGRRIFEALLKPNGGKGQTCVFL